MNEIFVSLRSASLRSQQKYLNIIRVYNIVMTQLFIIKYLKNI